MERDMKRKRGEKSAESAEDRRNQKAVAVKVEEETPSEEEVEEFFAILKRMKHAAAYLQNRGPRERIQVVEAVGDVGGRRVGGRTGGGLDLNVVPEAEGGNNSN